MVQKPSLYVTPISKLLSSLSLLLLAITGVGQTFAVGDSTFKVGDVMRSYESFFGYAQTTLSADHFEVLDSVAAFMNEHPIVVLEVGVHFDERGRDSYSILYSQIRAQRIVEYLIAKRVSSDRLRAVGYEGKKPLIVNAKTEEEHQKNRRTEFKILTK
jgi:outer membrane protein OmpA-like peptidoglycan-associated protein